jgi:hypothetical protein
MWALRPAWILCPVAKHAFYAQKLIFIPNIDLNKMAFFTNIVKFPYLFFTKTLQNIFKQLSNLCGKDLINYAEHIMPVNILRLVS